jgi:hypothetical protein
MPDARVYLLKKSAIISSPGHLCYAFQGRLPRFGRQTVSACDTTGVRQRTSGRRPGLAAAADFPAARTSEELQNIISD